MPHPTYALPYLSSFDFHKMIKFGLKTIQDQTCPVLTALVWCIPGQTSPACAGLVWYTSVLFPKFIHFSASCSYCPFFVSNLYFIPLISGWILISRRGPSTDKMRPGHPSGVALARRLRDVDLLLLIVQVTTPLTPAMKIRKSMRCLSGMHLLSGPPIWSSDIPRRQSRALSMTIVKPLCMKAVSSPMILIFGLSSTPTGTVPSISTRRGQWWRPSG
jgi:hypothetical protein